MPIKPALQQFIEDFVGGSFTVAISNPTVNTVATQVAGNNFERMSLTVINSGSVTVTLLPQNNVSASMGIQIAANGGSVSLDAQEDLALVGWSWYAVTAAIPGTVTVVETIRFNVTPEPSNAPNPNP